MTTSVYKIYDKQKQEYWSTDNGKDLWLTKGAAKNAWKFHVPSRTEFPEGYKESTIIRGKYNPVFFKDQERYVLYQATLENWQEV